MPIFYHAEEVKLPPIMRKRVSYWIKTVIGSFGKKAGDIAYIFCSDEKMLAINKQYLNHDYYTDIITFDYTENNVVSGDIFIGTDTVQNNARQFGVSYGEELHRVIIHGILHLCGVGDKSPEERENMTLQENIALIRLTNLKL
jgi:rRNA maturation RNase YbeY